MYPIFVIAPPDIGAKFSLMVILEKFWVKLPLILPIVPPLIIAAPNDNKPVALLLLKLPVMSPIFASKSL